MRLAAEYQQDRVRALAAERLDGELAVRWHGTIEEGEGPEDRAGAVAERLGAAGIDPDDVAVGIRVSPGLVVRGLELPPLSRSEVDQVVRDELRRVSGEGMGEMEVRGWQFRSDPGRGPNVLAVGVPSVDVEEALEFGRRLPGSLRTVIPTPVALHHGMMAAGLASEDRLHGFIYLADDFGFVGYGRGPAWVSSHVFPLSGDGDAASDSVLKEVKRSLIGLRSREDGGGGRPSSLFLAGKLPGEDLALRLQEELPEADIGEFGLEETLRLDGVPHSGRFLSRQALYAVPLVLAAFGDSARINYVPRSARLPDLKRSLLRSAGAAAGAGLLLAALHWGWARWQTSGVLDRASGLRSEIERLEPQFARMQQQAELSSRLSVYRGFRDLSSRQLPLVEESLRSLSRAVSDGVGVDSLSVRQGSEVLGMEVVGSATGRTSSQARSRFDRLVARLRGSPVFERISVARQDLGRQPDGTLAVRYRIRASLAGRLRPSGESG